MPDKEKSENREASWPGLPKPLEHRLSTKWTTFEALRILQLRLRAGGSGTNVVLFTSAGVIQGELVDISESYEQSVGSHSLPDMDVISATVHLRTDLWTMYAQKDQELQPVDSAAVIRLKNVVTRIGNRRIHLPQLGVFASDVAAFTLTTDPIM